MPELRDEDDGLGLFRGFRSAVIVYAVAAGVLFLVRWFL